MSCAFSSVRAPSEILSTSKQTSMSNRYACYLNPCNKYSRCTSLKKKIFFRNTPSAESDNDRSHQCKKVDITMEKQFVAWGHLHLAVNCSKNTPKQSGQF